MRVLRTHEGDLQEKAHQPIGSVSGTGNEQEQRNQVEAGEMAPAGHGDADGEGAERTGGQADSEGR